METLSSIKKQSWLIWFLRGLLIFGFIVLFARLIDLQVIRGKYYKALAEGNRIKRVKIIAPRGRIFARGGELIATNIENLVNENKVEEKLSDTSNEEVVINWKRNYPQGINFAHITGYLGEVSEEELGKVEGYCPEKGPRIMKSLVGRSGLEEEYDCILSGVDGEELIEVDAKGNKVRVLGIKNSIDGQDLKTNIDFGLQMKISDLMKDKKGGVIVTNTNGEVLALYSSPSFDPNVFQGKSEEISDLLSNSELPLFNRIIGGKYHPGSVFKPFVAIASLEEKKIDSNYLFEDTGVITIKNIYGTYSYANWFFTQYGGKEGKIGVIRAITRSTDTFFYKIGELLGPEKIGEWAKKFSLDKKSNIDIPGEIEGLIPSPDWKQTVKGEKWFLGNTYHMSIGQGDIALTPVAVNTAISSIANDGKYCEPSLVKKSKCRDIPLSQENIKIVKEGMKGVCSSGGTGYTFFDFFDKTKINVACKTGTAETEKGEPHAWFVAYAPIDNPEIIATVLVEQGGEGSKVAGPIAREIFNYWFKATSDKTSITVQ